MGDSAHPENTLYSLSALTVFRSIREDALIAGLHEYIRFFLSLPKEESLSQQENTTLIEGYTDLFALLSETQKSVDPSLTEHIFRVMHRSDNPFSREGARRGSTFGQIDEQLLEAATADIRRVLMLFTFSAEPFTSRIHAETGLSLPLWRIGETRTANDILSQLFTHYQERGFGLFSENHAFLWKNKSLHAVQNPDPIKKSQLYSYEYEIGRIDENTRKLVMGRPAENLLLFGARGTGKSSAVKAMANTYCDRGLRLIEIDKDELLTISDLLEYISGYTETRFSFILYLDDLTFVENDNRYTALKTLLEGGMKTRPKNTAIYATSNRRHLIAEKKEQELYTQDARNEKLSLSDRFGMAIRFASPTKAEFQEIVRGILSNRGLPFDAESIDDTAAQWAMHENGFSPRTAKQFCDYYESNLE